MAQSLADGLQLVRSLRLAAGAPLAYDLEDLDLDLDRRIRADPRPKVFVTGHLGSWEAMGSIAGTRQGGQAAFISRRIANPFVDRLFNVGVLSLTRSGAPRRSPPTPRPGPG